MDSVTIFMSKEKIGFFFFGGSKLFLPLRIIRQDQALLDVSHHLVQLQISTSPISTTSALQLLSYPCHAI